MAGRKLGSKNKVSSVARLKLAKLKCDPIERAVICANELYEEGHKQDAGRIYLDLIGYVVPKLKAVDHTIGENTDLKDTALQLSESLQLIAAAAREAEKISTPSTRTH